MDALLKLMIEVSTDPFERAAHLDDGSALVAARRCPERVAGGSWSACDIFADPGNDDLPFPEPDESEEIASGAERAPGPRSGGVVYALRGEPKPVVAVM